MRRWWLWLVVALGLFWGGGQRVEAALPYQDLLFENVTWGIGQFQGGIVFAPPSDLWTVVGTDLPIYFYRTTSLPSPSTKTGLVKVERTYEGENNTQLVSELKADTTSPIVWAIPKTIGIQHYTLSTSGAFGSIQPFTMQLTLHVVDHLPSDLRLNAGGLDIFDFVPFQFFPIDSQGHKYLTKLFWSNQIKEYGDKALLPVLRLPNLQPLTSDDNLAVYIDYESGLSASVNVGSLIGRYTIVHQPRPVVVNRAGEATVKLPVILPPAGKGQVRLVWRNDSGEGMTLPIQADGTVHFSDLKPVSFPMTWRIEYKTTPFLSINEKISDYDSVTYTNIQGDFKASLGVDLLTLPLPPLFSGQYDLAEIANGPVLVSPTWDQLDITASGPWTLRMGIKSPLVLPMRLRLGEQETGTDETAIELSGIDEQTVSLAESRLIIPRTALLSPGTYKAEISFSLIRGPTP